MKLCLNCKWYNLDRCTAPQNMITNPVDGQQSFRQFEYCSTHRTGDYVGWFGARFVDLCGKEGRWFQPKE